MAAPDDFDFSGMDESVQNHLFADNRYKDFVPDFSVGNTGAGAGQSEVSKIYFVFLSL
jgi:hypothetical protein